MNFNKNFWTFFAFICSLVVLIDGLSRFKLRYASAESDGFPAEYLPNLAEREVQNDAIDSDDLEFHKRAAEAFSLSQGLSEFASEQSVNNVDSLCGNRRFKCNKDAKFRAFDGSCNNPTHSDWGMAIQRLRRLLTPKYADDIDAPRVAANGGPLPLARFVRTTAIPDITSEDERTNHLFPHFGQFLTHDLIATKPSAATVCCDNPDGEDCLPLMIPENDPDLSRLNQGCMEFTRSMKACGKNKVRQQINSNTGFIDGSQVYGSNLKESLGLRTMQGGLLQSSDDGLNLPVKKEGFCATQGTGTNFCFRAGDGRLNIQPGLISVHTLFMREHNRIAGILHTIAPHFDDEKLFQETRRILIAELESIVYNEYLPILLGPHLMQQHELELPKDGETTTYKSDVDPSIINSFSTAAFRFGHSMVRNNGQVGHTTERYALKDNYFDPTVVHRAGADSILTGCTVQRSEAMDNFMVAGVTRFLFKEPNKPFGFDLGSFNIERGRDHGLPSYNDFREFCELPRIESFSELNGTFKDSRAEHAFETAYEDIDDIDLFVGGIAEKPVAGGVVGPTFACIIGVQFHRLLFGDRHFFTHGHQAGSFTADERAMLSKRTLASVMCDNLSLDSVQLKAFLVADKRNRVVSCAEHPQMDLDKFF